jgi:hypothetical protein
MEKGIENVLKEGMNKAWDINKMKKNSKKIMINIKDDLKENIPCLTKILNNLKIKEDYDYYAISTDGKIIRYHPKMVESYKRNIKELKVMVFFTVIQILLNHNSLENELKQNDFKWDSDKHLKFNIASNIVVYNIINNFIKYKNLDDQLEFPLETPNNLFNNYPKELKNKNIKEIFKIIKDKDVEEYFGIKIED